LYLVKSPGDETCVFWCDISQIAIEDVHKIQKYNEDLKNKSIKWKWQYLLLTDQNGLKAGWHDYSAHDNALMEDAMLKKQKLISFQTNKFEYNIDLEFMVQTNVKTETTRALNRVQCV
jgi:macrodomain Ter protein organizer (MatP/YcbG family)